MKKKSITMHGNMNVKSGSVLVMDLTICTFDSIMLLPHRHDLFLLRVVHAHTTVHLLILLFFPCIC